MNAAATVSHAATSSGWAGGSQKAVGSAAATIKHAAAACVRRTYAHTFWIANLAGTTNRPSLRRRFGREKRTKDANMKAMAMRPETMGDTQAAHAAAGAEDALLSAQLGPWSWTMRRVTTMSAAVGAAKPMIEGATLTRRASFSSLGKMDRSIPHWQSGAQIKKSA